MDADETVRAYYDALREGEALDPFFSDVDGLVKFGVSERLVGHGAVVEGLREQTRTTTGWTVESRALQVTERERHAWFSDSVALAWTDAERGIRYEFDTRWSGTLEREDGDWRFVGMHVSTADEL